MGKKTMAKKKLYEIKDYYPEWDIRDISSDLNEMASRGFEVLSTMSIGFHNEISRYPSTLPGLNDGDQVFSSGTMRVVFVK
jgi:hypothetical protein